MFLKTRYYPVNIHAKKIYNDPQCTEGKCSLNSTVYRNKGTVGIKGDRLNKFMCYKTFEVVTPVRIINEEVIVCYPKEMK